MRIKTLVATVAAAATLALGLPTASQAVVAYDSVSELNPQWYTRLDFGGKTHYYASFDQYKSFSDAKALASEYTLNGVAGHLPTVTSVAENRALRRIARKAGDLWLGLQDTTHNESSATPRTWKWVTGAENGTTVTSCTGWWLYDENSGQEVDGGCANTAAYSNWASREPNNSGGREDAGMMYDSGSWNDTSPDDWRAVVVEFTVPTVLPAEDESASNYVSPDAGVKKYSRLDINGKTHYYVYFDDRMSFQQAMDEAPLTKYKGVVGHLPTITSAAENDAVKAVSKASYNDVWLGLKDTTHNKSAATPRTWKWAAGTENGTLVTSCTGWWSYDYDLDQEVDGGCTNTAAYSNWNEGEPNNGGGGEVYAEMRSSGKWNDYSVGGNDAVVYEYTMPGIEPDEAAAVAAPVPYVDTYTNYRVVNVSWGEPEGGIYADSVVRYDVSVKNGDGKVVGSCKQEADEWGYVPTGCKISLPAGTFTASVTATFATLGTSSATVSAPFTVTNWVNRTLPAGTFTVAAAGKRADVLFDTGYSQVTHSANGSGWYYSPNYSWGFANDGDAVNRYSCDTAAAWSPGANGAARLCWHTRGGKLNGGWRAGNYYSLWTNTAFRAVYVAHNPTYYPYGPQGNVTQAQLAAGGWTLCHVSAYADADIPLSQVLDEDCQGTYMLLAGMAGVNTWVGVQPPGAPTAVTATGGNGEASVAWTAPASDGGKPISGYTATASPGGKSCTTTGATSCTITGLSQGTTYSVTVTATSIGGTSEPSTATSATTFDIPGAPTNLSSTPGGGQVTLSWTAPASDGGSAITRYSVSDGNGHTCTTAGETTCAVTGLANGVTYTFTVTATNVVGTGAASDPLAAAPAVAPKSPTGVTVTAGDRESTVSWTAPADDGGSAVTAYKVTASTGQTCSTAIGVSLDFLSCTVTGLDNLKWVTFTVVATNVVGDSDASDASDAIAPHTSDFQIWVPSANIARDGGSTDIYVFGATGEVSEVRLKVGNQIMTDTPDENGTVVFSFTAYNGAASRWKAQARAVRGTGSEKERLYAFSWIYAPKITMRKSYANGAEIVLKAGTAAPDTELSVQVDGVEVCRETVGADGKFACTLNMDTTADGDYTAELYSGEELMASRDFTIRPARAPR